MKDEESLAATYRLHYPAVVRFVTGFSAGALDAADLAHETFLRLARSGSGVPRERVRFWLIRVARNLALNEMRRRRFIADDGSLAGTADPADDPEAAMVRRDEIQRCLTALEKLPVEWRGMLVLREVEEMSYAQIAASLDVSLAKVKTDLFRARMRLREILGKKR